jgi:hypothetical protein
LRIKPSLTVGLPPRRMQPLKNAFVTANANVFGDVAYAKSKRRRKGAGERGSEGAGEKISFLISRPPLSHSPATPLPHSPLPLTIFFETSSRRQAFMEEPDSHGQIPQ